MLPVVPAKGPRSNAFVLLDIDLSDVALLNGPRPTLLDHSAATADYSNTLDLASGNTHYTERTYPEAWKSVLEDPEGRILRNTTGGDFARIAHAEINGMPTLGCSTASAQASREASICHSSAPQPRANDAPVL